MLQFPRYQTIMENQLINLKDVKIRPTVLLIFIVLLSIAGTISISLQYYFLKDLAYSSAVELINQTSNNTKEKYENLDKISHDIVSTLELTYGIGDYPENMIQPTLIKEMTTSILNNNFINSIYVGYNNNNFYEIINLDIDVKIRERYNAKSDERWLVIKIFHKDEKRVRLEQFLDINLNVKRNEFEEAEYMPTERTWYKEGIQTDKLITTSPYLFSNTDSYGVSYAKKLSNNKAVLGLDISLQSISTFLKTQAVVKGSELYLFENNNSIIATNLDKIEFAKDLESKLTMSMNKRSELMTIGEKDYFISNINIDTSSDAKIYLSIFIPEYEIMKDSNKKILYATLINILFMILVLPLIWRLSKIVTNPIEALEFENEKIKKRKFDEVLLVKTPISEIYNLSKSFVSMSQSIKEYEEAQEKLMDSIVQLIATTIDAKSKYTAGHCERVPTLTLMLAREAKKSNNEVFKEFKRYSKDQKRELSIAAWLHDCGKVTTPIHIVDKATKLETIYNRIHEIRTRFEVIHRDLTIESLHKLLNGEDKKEVEFWLESEREKLIKDFEFIAQANMGAEFMNENNKERIREIAKREWTRYFDNTLGISYEEQTKIDTSDKSTKEFLLSDKKSHITEWVDRSQADCDKYGFKVDVPKHQHNTGEIHNLTIERGTLTVEERFKINEHIIMTIKMLEKLPFPEYLKNIPEFAGAHHETLIGTGYPRKLTKEQMSIEARMMAVADVFEALTASDRPYKQAKTLSESIKILSFMVKDQHLDADIFKLFLSSGIYLEYGKRFLSPEQIDYVNIEEYL